MKKTILFIGCLFLAFPVFSQYSVTGGQGAPLLAEENSAGRIQVYLLNGLSGAEISFTGPGTHQWYRYNTRTSEAVAIPCLQNDAVSTITDVADGFGYFVGLNQPDPLPDDPSSTSYLWIIDYSKYVPAIYFLEVQEEEDKCEYLKLITHIEAPPLRYHTYSGAILELQRTFHLLYDNLEWLEESLAFVPKKEDQIEPGVVSEMVIDAPLTNTVFTFAGDDYATHFGIEQQVSTAEYQAIALEVHAVAESFKEAAPNELNAVGESLGGSAPVEISFTAYANEPVATMYIWKIVKKDPVTQDSVTLVRYTDKAITYRFEDTGNFTAQLEVVDAQSVCFNNSQVFDVFIGDSDLQLPNAFSPGSTPGVNDEYRVAYKSLVSFKASIYNRWGNLLYHWEDPSQGWDGRVAGKYVPTGVYFIVVEAKGADGKVYRRSSDINVLRRK